MQSSSSSRTYRIMALAKKIKTERYAPDQVRNSEILERHLLQEENAALVTYDNANYVIATDNDNNKPGTSLLRVDLSPELKDDLQISDFVSDNDDDSIKVPNYESDSSSSSSSSSSTSSDSSSLSSSDSPGCNGFLSNSNNVSQVADTPLADSQAVNTPATSIQVPDVEVADTLDANLQASGPEVPDTQLADTQPANTQPADTKISSPKKRGKKRVAVPENWLSNKAKKLRNSGQAYTSRSKSEKPIVARCIRPACGDKCRLKCSNKMDENTRKDIFKKYWALENINRQRDFIHKCMKPVKPAYRYSSAERPRQHNNAYYFHINNNEQVRVCKYFFMAALDINNRITRTVVDKAEKGFLEVDLRGKHKNHKKVDPSIKDGVREHIRSIPRIESHYLRKQTNREYIEGGKNLTDIFNDYKQNCQENNLPHANLVMFSKIFNTEFNISFFMPRKDRCELCDAYENAIGEAKEILENKYVLHLEEKDLSRKEKDQEKAKANPNYIVSVYDLQAVLPTPQGTVSVFYYKSKLNCYNFTVSDLKTGSTECYFWHEGHGNRGSDEIGSCVLNFIEKKLGTSNNEAGFDFVFFSDNCCGQQKNRFLVAMYIYALGKYPKIRSITHKYLISGHSQNEGDSVHSTIEKAVKKSLKSGPIYVPSQYAQIIRLAKKKKEPYHVNEFGYLDFYSLKKLCDDIGMTGIKSLKITEVKVFKLNQENPTTLYYKTSYKDEEFKQVDLCRRKNNTIPSTLQQAYKSVLSIKENKKKDLLDLVKHNHIPSCYSAFYNSL